MRPFRLDSKTILSHLLYPTDLNLRIKEYKFIDFAILQAKRTIAFNWKKKRKEAPAIGAWTKSMVRCMSIKRITDFENRNEILRLDTLY